MSMCLTGSLIDRTARSIFYVYVVSTLVLGEGGELIKSNASFGKYDSGD